MISYSLPSNLSPDEIIERMENTYCVKTDEYIESGFFFIRGIDLALWRLAWKMKRGVALNEEDRMHMERFNIRKEK
ncbi:MAG: hypothetical protein JW885_02610 [Deltaproteobacteria bacterium]|nr:hypothetical protein [Candidatus Zymogenaceae bacterium]